MRIYKYEVGDAFPEHIDYKMHRKSIEMDETGMINEYVDQSFFSLLIYLNHDFKGGETGYWPDHDGIHCRFLRDLRLKKKGHQVLIKPKTGKAVVQYQNILHEGLPTTTGIKYLLRADMIHRRKKLRHPKLPPLTESDVITGEWEQLFEASCKNYAD